MTPALTICGREINIRGRLLRVARTEGDKYRFLDDPRLVVEGLQNSGRRIDLFTFIQRVSETSPKYRYPMEWDNFAALPISTFEHWWTRQVDAKTRNMVRRADKKGVVVREVTFDEKLVCGVWEVYNECPIRQGKPFPHYGKDIETVRKMSATFLTTSIFIGAFLGNQMIGFVKLTIDETRSQAGVMHIIAMLQHRDKAPTNALIAESVKACTKRNIPYLVYSNFAYGKKQRDSLSDFKKNNGFQRIDVPRYFVPMTRIGALAFRMGMHHKLIERLPESLIAKLRDLRAGWYSRKLQSSVEAT